MSTQPITPDANAAPTSTVGAIAAAPDASSLPVTSNPAQPAPQVQPTAPPPTQPSRLGKILSAVAGVAETGLAGVPDRGRPSIVGGLGEGARAEQQAQAVQQAIKFKSFDDQTRLAELHNQDLKMQNDNQAQQDAHTEAELHMRSMANDLGIDYDTIANHGPAVMDHLAAQTALTGAASVPSGTHISADGQNIYMPSNPDSQATRDGQKQLYQKLAPALGLPSLPANAQFVPNKNMNMLTNKVNGFALDGSVPKHDDLPALISTAQVQRDNLAQNGGSPDQLKTLDNVIGIYKANLDALDKHAASVKESTSQATTAGKIAAQTDPNAVTGQANLAGAKAGAVANATLPSKEALQDNASSNKTSTDSNSLWLPKVTADEKKKAELAENIAENSNAVAQILIKRPNLVGAVAGRYTSAEQMIGNNDPDIAALGTRIHNIAMANSGVHGFRSQEGVEGFEKQVLNNFRNGPQAVAGALKATTGSVQTFIDNARPETYKTHSKQGGAVRAMVTQ